MCESRISSNLLFHYTKSIDIVISILEHGFYPRVAIEDISFRLPRFEKHMVGIPMVCFTDIPEEVSKEHRSFYGKYGLALTKEWGIKKGLNPICYVLKTSELCNSFNNVQSCLKSLSNKSNDNNARFDAMSVAMTFGGYLKLYSEKLPDGSEKVYYNEREWRYLPPFIDNEETCNILEGECLDDESKESLNHKMEKKYSLKFTEDDLKKIILPDCNVDEFKKKLYSSSIHDPEIYIKKIEIM